MARRSSKGHTRDASDIATPVRLSSLPSTPSTYLQQLEDRRTWFPDPVVPARAFRRSATQLVVPKNVRAPGRLPTALQFARPDEVAICVRRHRRREVLFATGGVGRKRKRAKWSEYSSVRCR